MADTASGVSSPTRPASVTLLPGDQAGNPARMHSLEHSAADRLDNTRSLYGLHTTSPTPASTSPLGRTTSPTSREIPRHRATSVRSTTSRHSATSPPRSTLTLPTPRAFLTPKKPASAIRLENRAAAAQSGSSGDHADDGETSKHEELPTIHRGSSGHIHPRSESPLPDEVMSLDQAHDMEGSSTAPELNASPGQAHLHRQLGWDRSIGRSMTTLATPPRTVVSEMSSDALVRTQDLGMAEKADAFPDRRQRRIRSSPPGSQRNYETFENPLTTFFCGGHLMTGGDNYLSIAFALMVLLGVSGVWIGTTGVWLWQHGREYGLARGAGVGITILFVYLFGVCLSSFLVSALRDSGIIPRRLDLDPPTYQENDWWEAYPREIQVHDEKVTVKYCETCESYRPPRSSHCRLCGNCVDGIDHHCSYLHNCVGKRNYFSFLATIVSAAIADIYIVVFSAVHFSLLCHHDHITFRRALAESPGAAVSFLLGVLTLLPVGFLLTYHLRLLWWNLTTVEQIRSSASRSFFSTNVRPDNPFATGSFLSNIVLASIGRPQFPSWINPSGVRLEDRREVNPALCDLSWVNHGL
ncbi:hypothetical protein IAU60_004091 [Kwoniella sp. DSM 27419]